MFETLAISLLLSAGVERMSLAIEDTRAHQDWYYFVDIGAKWEDGPITVYGSVKTDFVPVPGTYMFAPFHNLYLVGAKVEVGQLEIGAEHECEHPQTVLGREPGIQFDGGRETIYVRGRF